MQISNKFQIPIFNFRNKFWIPAFARMTAKTAFAERQVGRRVAEGQSRWKRDRPEGSPEENRREVCEADWAGRPEYH